MSMKRKGILAAACATFALAVLAGCMNAGSRMNTNENGATNAPQVTAGSSVMPEATSAIQTAFDWVSGRAGVEDKINLLSEIDKSRIVTAGPTALVGVTFAREYKGEMTQRIHNLIAGIVQEADPNIQVVAVTSEKEDVDRINAIADQLGGGALSPDAESQIDTIVRNVTTMQ